MQVYGDLRIVSARPTAADEAVVPHALYGSVDPGRRYSVGDWLRDLDHLDAPRPWILTGGTGLYFNALERGLAAIPAVPADVRDDIEARIAAAGPASVHADLARLDAEGAARLDPADAQRVARSLGVLVATGRPIRDWQARKPSRPTRGAVVRVVLEPPRPLLRERMAERFHGMMGEGAVEEVRALLARDLDPALPAMKAIGVREIAEMLRGGTTEADAVERAIIATRQYAKRQSTWFRNQFGPEWLRIASAEEIEG